MALWYILWPFGIFMAMWYILWPCGIVYGLVVYFVAIWSILLTFGIFCGHVVYFSRIGMLYQEKSGNPAEEAKYLTDCLKKVSIFNGFVTFETI
jgi:hypothetical protein